MRASLLGVTRDVLLQTPHIRGAGGRQPARARQLSYGRDVWKRLCVHVLEVWDGPGRMIHSVSSEFRPRGRAGSFPITYGSHSRTQATGMFSFLLEPSPSGRHSHVSIETCFLPVPGTQLGDFC